MTGHTPDPVAVLTARTIRFGDVEIDVDGQTILRAGAPVQVEPKVFAVALELLRQPGRLVTRDALLDAVWGHRHVTPGVLTRAIAQLRQAFGDDPHQPRYIQTRHGIGYCFIGERIEAPPTTDALATSAADCRTGGTLDASALQVDPEHTAPARHWRPRAGGIIASAIALVVAAAAWWTTPDVPSTGQDAAASVAVLPFETAGEGDRDDVFAAGLSMELRDALAGVPGLQVAAASPVQDGPVADLQTFGRSLGVARVLDGSVRRDTDRVRIHVRLVDPATGTIAWTRSYERPLAALFDLQAEIARDVAGRLLGSVPAVEMDALGHRLTPTANVAAFDAYLHGLRQLTTVMDVDAAGRAEAGFERALALDAGFARAQAGLCRVELWRFDAHKQPAAFDTARTACLRAVRMDPGDGRVRLALGDLYRMAGDPDTAAGHYRAAEHDPAWHGAALAGLAKLQFARGDVGGALATLQAASQAAPTDAALQAELGYHAYLAGQLEVAVATYRRVVALEPREADYWDTFGALLLAAGDHAGAQAALERGVAIEPSETALSNLGTLLYQDGDHAGAAARFRQALALSDTAHHQVWGNLGDALLADPATRPRAGDAFREAAIQAERYLRAQPDDPQTLAALGWYRANTGDASAARRLAARATLRARDAADIGEVALITADIHAALGDLDQARARLAVARGAGIAPIRIATDDVLQRAGLVEPAHAPAQTSTRE